MVNNLDSKLENSTISAVSAPDINDDEVEIDLREIFYALKKKILKDMSNCCPMPKTTILHISF